MGMLRTIAVPTQVIAWQSRPENLGARSAQASASQTRSVNRWKALAVLS